MSDWVLKYSYDFHGAKYVYHFYKASIISPASVLILLLKFNWQIGLLGIVSRENFVSPYKNQIFILAENMQSSDTTKYSQ